VDSAILSKCEVASPDVADGDGASRPVINAQRVGELLPAFFGPDVKEVAPGWVTAEVDQVNDAVPIHGDLGLDAPIWDALEDDFGALPCPFGRKASGG
jgi:hypothetical protein